MSLWDYCNYSLAVTPSSTLFVCKSIILTHICMQSHLPG